MRKKVTVIVGGSSGLGLAAAKCMAAETTLLLCARGAAALEKAKRDLEEYGAEVLTWQMDASDSEETEKCAKFAAETGDVIHVIHTAGLSPASHGADDILRVNTLGPINMVQAFYPVLAEGGVMIVFGSTAGYTMDTVDGLTPLKPVIRKVFEQWRSADFPDKLKQILTDVMKLPAERQAGMAYCLSKNFVKYFVYANAWRFAKKGCRILSVSPGAYLTPMHQALIDHQPVSAERTLASIPLQRWGHPYEMGELVKFLCSPGAGYITGVDILADGGCTYAGTVTPIEA